MPKTFYACLDLLNKKSAVKSTLPPADWPLSVSTADVRKTLMRVNMSKAAGPDHVLRTCAKTHVNVIINILLSQESVSTCFKTAIVPVPKKSAVSSLNDHHPVAFAPILMKGPHGSSPVCIQSQQIHLTAILGVKFVDDTTIIVWIFND